MLDGFLDALMPACQARSWVVFRGYNIKHIFFVFPLNLFHFKHIINALLHVIYSRKINMLLILMTSSPWNRG